MCVWDVIRAYKHCVMYQSEDLRREVCFIPISKQWKCEKGFSDSHFFLQYQQWLSIYTRVLLFNVAGNKDYSVFNTAVTARVTC